MQFTVDTSHSAEHQNAATTIKSSNLKGQAASEQSFQEISGRVDTLDKDHIHRILDTNGWCILPALLSQIACSDLISLYDHDEQFRSTIKMARHGFGSGEYRYFNYPLPPMVELLRQRLYSLLVPIANEWAQRLSEDHSFPEVHSDYLAECAAHGQTKPTPLILKYEAGDFNCLHQDLYGNMNFPLQVALLLSEPGQEFTGGEFVITEQRPRMQSRPHVVPLKQGDAVIFPVRHRPKNGVRRDYRTTMRHGVSEILSGRRYAAGIIFHDAG